MKPTNGYTPAGPSSNFAEFWHWTNILLDVKNSENAKLLMLEKMESHFDDDTREHFRMALAQVLRQDKDYSIRKQALSLLAAYFEWHEIEWTLWLHRKRQPRDWHLIITYELYCQRKRFNKDDDMLHKVIIEQVNQKMGIKV